MVNKEDFNIVRRALAIDKTPTVEVIAARAAIDRIQREMEGHNDDYQL